MRSNTQHRIVTAQDAGRMTEF